MGGKLVGPNGRSCTAGLYFPHLTKTPQIHADDPHCDNSHTTNHLPHVGGILIRQRPRLGPCAACPSALLRAPAPGSPQRGLNHHGSWQSLRPPYHPTCRSALTAQKATPAHSIGTIFSIIVLRPDRGASPLWLSPLALALATSTYTSPQVNSNTASTCPNRRLKTSIPTPLT